MSERTPEQAPSLRETASQLADTVKAEGAGLAQTATERVSELAEELVAAGASQAEGVSRALDRAAEQLEQGAPMLAGYARQAAGAVDRLAAGVRDGSPGEWLHDAMGMARQNPAGLFGAAMLAGFALARFTRASAPTHSHHARSGDAEALRHAGGRAPGWSAHEGEAPIPNTMAAASLGGAAAYHARKDV